LVLLVICLNFGQTIISTNMKFIVDNIRSASNIGSIFRTADSLGVSEILLCGISSTPPNKEILKTALGATETVKWQYFAHTKDAVDYCQKLHMKIVALEQTSGSVLLQHFRTTANTAYAIVVGNEVEGVQHDIIQMADTCVEIPQFGQKKSLNVSVAAGIICWEMLKQQQLG
jgi:23S rRNA (guanosine2251-2'-O)-methyltransferase